ncbi:MAG: ANTAR domain-containing protein [Clostridia bacterium]|nr:ANTAR domain-containing protein [Clostridia bacterium]
MTRIIVAFQDEAINQKLSLALRQAGYEVFRTCMSAGQVMRAFSECQNGILVCGCRFPDRTVNTLAEDLEGKALILALGRADQLELCEHRDLFKLRLPAGRGELSAAVEMLVQLNQKRLPRRSAGENELVERAKALMMARGLSEQQAHRTLQQTSMRLRIKMTEAARRVIEDTL